MPSSIARRTGTSNSSIACCVVDSTFCDQRAENAHSAGKLMNERRSPSASHVKNARMRAQQVGTATSVRKPCARARNSRSISSAAMSAFELKWRMTPRGESPVSAAMSTSDVWS